MGISLVMVAWRIARTASVANGRFIVIGTLLLGLGYAVLLPIHESGLVAALKPHAHSHAATVETYGFHTVELAVMNGGWLLFGIGMARHARVFGSPPASRSTLTIHDPLSLRRSQTAATMRRSQTAATTSLPIP